MSDPTDKPEPTKLDDSSTTVTIRKWISTDLAAVQELLVYPNHGADHLPPTLRALAEELMAKGTAWPRWLIMGVAVRWMRGSIESAIGRASAPAEVPVEEQKPKRGSR